MSEERGTGAVGAGDGSVELIDVVKRFGATTAVDDLNLLVQAGEFLSLLGPSGCGKTTTLRMLAGFEDPNEGEIRISGHAVQGVPPHKRDVNTVFQNYALFPHMSASENVAYGLRQKKVDRGERGRRVGGGAGGGAAGDGEEEQARKPQAARDVRRPAAAGGPRTRAGEPAEPPAP